MEKKIEMKKCLKKLDIVSFSIIVLLIMSYFSATRKLERSVTPIKTERKVIEMDSKQKKIRETEAKKNGPDGSQVKEMNDEEFYVVE